MTDIKVPSLGESVTEATVSQILKESGSTVKMDEEILELETDKVNQVLYAPESGVLTLNVKVEDQVKVGQVIGSVAAGKGEPVKEEKPVESKSVQEESPKKELVEEEKPVEPKPAEIQPKKAGIEKGARISVDETFEELKEGKPKTETQSSKEKPKTQYKVEGKVRRVRMSKLRRIISEKLVQVKNETAMLTTFNELDMSAVMQVRKKEQENFQKKFGIKLGLMSFFMKACVHALKEFPAINGMIDRDELVYFEEYHIGVAVGTDKGLFVPVIRNCDQKTYAEIEKELKNFAEKARAGTIAIEDLQGGTFTITNGGVYGSMLSTPILNPPQSGILGMHNIVNRPIVLENQIVIRPMMYLALSYDHRIVDGKESIGFLMSLKKNLEDPARLLLEL